MTRLSRSALACALAATLCAGATITISPVNQQRITGWGIYTENRPDWGSQYVVSGSSAACEAAYRELGATHLRIDLANTCFGAAGIRTEVLAACKTHILAATSRGMAYFISMWTPPAEMKDPPSTAGVVNGVNTHLRADMEDLFVQRVTECITWLIAQGCPMPAAFSFQNEPDWNPWYDGCVYDAAQYQRVAKKFRAWFDAHSLAGLKMHCADAGYENALLSLLGNGSGDLRALDSDAELNRAVSIISVHTYDMHNGACEGWARDILQRFVNATRGRSQELWMTEYSAMEVQNQDSWQGLMNTVRHLNRDMSSLGFNLWSYWQVWGATEGLFIGGTAAITRTPWFYVFRKLWTSVPAGSHVRTVSCTDAALLGDNLANCGQDFSAYLRPDGGTVLVVTNPTAGDRTFDVTGLSGTQATLYRMGSQYVDNTDMTAAGRFTVSGGTAAGVSFPANTISILVSTGATGVCRPGTDGGARTGEARRTPCDMHGRLIGRDGAWTARACLRPRAGRAGLGVSTPAW